MPQQSKVLKSREEWRKKASERADQNREYRKQVKIYRQRIAELKTENKALKQLLEKKHL